MTALTPGEVKFNIASSDGADNHTSVHTLSSIEVGGKTFSDFISPDNVTFNISDVKGESHEAKLFVGSDGGLKSSLWPQDGARNDQFEEQSLAEAFKSDDLNAYVDMLELSFKGQQSYTLQYDTPVTVTDEGFIFITEKNGNNTQTVQFLDKNGDVLGEAAAIDRFEQDGTYLDMGIKTWSDQNVHASVFRLTDVEGLEAGAEIHSVNVIMNVTPWGPNPKSGDGGDGKVFFFGNKYEMQPCNNPPVAVKDQFETEFDTPFTGNVLLNDSDPDGDPLSVKFFTEPENGTIVMDKDTGEFTYTPDPGFFGEDSFKYVVTDGRGGYDSTTVCITVPCFAAGTLITTSEGPKPVEEIRVGDKVLSRDDGFQQVRWTGQRVLSAEDVQVNPDFMSVMIRAGALGNNLPRRDLRVSPGHRMLVSGAHAELMFGERDVLVAASDLVGLAGITLDSSAVTYVHVMFDTHQIIDAEGAWSESFQPADETLNGLDDQQRDELLALFPELGTRKGQRGYVSARRVLAQHESRALLAL